MIDNQRLAVSADAGIACLTCSGSWCLASVTAWRSTAAFSARTTGLRPSVVASLAYARVAHSRPCCQLLAGDEQATKRGRRVTEDAHEGSYGSLCGPGAVSLDPADRRTAWESQCTPG